ncbi:MAG: hypothetical protein WKF37_10950 [Bryobacteraceae bacterium]
MISNLPKSLNSKIAGVAVVLTAACLWAGLEGSYLLPLDHEAIQYAKAPVDDAISSLQKKISNGEVRLEYDDSLGYLPAILANLKVPISSQVLVFSKTSFQAPKISPHAPRALYFNDEVMVGFVRGGDVIELAVVDPKQGILFYTVDRNPCLRHASSGRTNACNVASGATLGVPGLVVRSVFRPVRAADLSSGLVRY